MYNNVYCITFFCIEEVIRNGRSKVLFIMLLPLSLFSIFENDDINIILFVSLYLIGKNKRLMIFFINAKNKIEINRSKY